MCDSIAGLTAFCKLTYCLECMSSTAIQMRRLESAQGRLIKQSIGLSKLSHNTALLKTLNIEKIEDIVNRNVLSLYNRIFKVESPARGLMQHLMSRFIFYGKFYILWHYFRRISK